MAGKQPSKKGAGFYFALIAALLCLGAGIYYQITYNGDQYYTSALFYTLIAAAPLAAVMIAAKIDGFLPAALCVLSGCAVLQFIYAMYWDVSVVLVGIDKQSFDLRFIVCCALMIGAFAVSEISLYTKVNQSKKIEA